MLNGVKAALMEKAKEYIARLETVEKKADDHEKRLKALEVLLMAKTQGDEKDLELEISPTKFKGLDQ